MNELQNTTVKSIRMEEELAEKIQKLAIENDRSFSQQVKFMLKKYLDIIEK